MESSSANLQERKRLNDDIERSFISTAYQAARIDTFNQTERGVTLLDLYELFFFEFDRLVILTGDLKHLRQSQDTVDKALSWIKEKPKLDTDSQIQARLKSGVIVFMSYKKVLSEQGVISLPSR
jgi:hypothetical protein